MIRVLGTELNQWDVGRYISVTNSEADHVHLANKGDSRAVIMEIVASQVKIPDYLLQSGKQICAYAVRDGVTVEREVFFVHRRERPENYVYEDDQRNYIYSLIDDVKDAVALAKDTAKSIADALASGALNGVDGITPHIGGNGNWYIGDIDTGVPAKGGVEKTPLKVQLFGDSATSETWAGSKWPSKLAGLLPEYALEIKNHAVGGNTLIHWAVGGLNKGVAWQIGLDAPTVGVQESGGAESTNIYNPIDPEADLVIVFAGSNDWGGGGAVDIIGDKSELFRETSAVAMEKSNLGNSGITTDGKVYTGVGTKYSVDYYSVNAGGKYRIYGNSVRYQIALPLGAFSTSVPANGVIGTVIPELENTENAVTDYDFQFTAPSDGYILIARTTDFPGLSVEAAVAPLNIGCIYGAVRHIAETAAAKAPATKLLFLTPMQRYSVADAAREVDPTTGNAIGAGGYQLVEVVDAIKEACGYYGIPCVDAYRTLGFNRANFKPGGSFTGDGLHPNADGDQRIAEMVANAIRSIFGGV